jgi:hypothetical protein
VNRIRSLRTLLAVRQRERDRLERSVAEQLGEYDAALAEVERVAAERAERGAQEQCMVEKRAALLTGQFTPHALRTLEFALVDGVRETLAAQKALEKTEAALRSKEREVEMAREALRRNRQRLEGFESLLTQARAAHAQRLDEAGEEEAEETSLALHSMRSRRSRQTS